MFKRTFAVLVATFALYGCGDTPQEVTDAKDRIFNGYYDANIHENTHCKAEQFNVDWVILCKSISGSNNQGIYEVKVLDPGRYVIYAVNGTAKTHAGRMGLHIEFNRESSVDIEEVKKSLG
ncbi:hypothetical protein HC752_21525 [Vibrio sp. S9_S30]|uniref:hypothetical protein n=1 Tax=Vibrio sp. S9_S30 TaxID=2720226 RepID=UPI00168079BB|nr:hypothetical protein [Vibrio sp. S9_S30]MBD1559527.1 hypothetical protein [Vibrio sp. S9_S30]